MKQKVRTCWWFNGSGLVSDVGQEGMCGWLKDKYGVSWQVVPRRLAELLRDEDRTAANRARDAMKNMRKINIAVLETAFNG